MAGKRVLIVGAGAREHALAWRLAQDAECKIFAWPGNAGTDQIGVNVHLNPERLAEQIAGLKADYVVIGSETYLANGLVDELAAFGIPAFGPTKAAAEIESSKSFALQVMKEAHVPHPESRVFGNPRAVVTFAKNYGKPVVVKADGLTGGRGVWLCRTLEEAEQNTNLCWQQYPGEPILVQELLEGQEMSIFCFTDGHSISPLIAACDYKRLHEDNAGPNTGGMGSYAWPRGWSRNLEAEILRWVIKPTIRRMNQRGTPFSGMLYAGLMLTKGGFKVLEFNSRPGDPEAQVIFPLLQGNLLEIMEACTEGRLHEVELSWNRRRHAVGVVLASRGYPGAFQSGYPVSLNGADSARNIRVFHASTRMEDGVLVTDEGSGRVLTVVGTGRSREQARRAAYAEVENIGFSNAVWRSDIAR